MITSGQHFATTASSVLCVVPPGPCLVQIANGGTASTVWVGAGTGVTSGNGFPVPSGSAPLSIPGWPGSQGGTLSVVASGGSASVSFLISSAQGSPGP